MICNRSLQYIFSYAGNEIVNLYFYFLCLDVIFVCLDVLFKRSDFFILLF